jgi:hypothetical protein
VLAILLSFGMKIGYGHYPFDYGYVFEQGRQDEERYMTDLLDHKVKVPEKYIRRIELQDERPPTGG